MYVVDMRAGHQNDGGKYVEYLATVPTATAVVDDAPVEVDMSIDGQGLKQGLGQEQGSVKQHVEPAETTKPRVKTPLPGLKQTYGGHAHLQSLLARKTNKPPGVQGGCWDRMFVAFTGSRVEQSKTINKSSLVE